MVDFRSILVERMEYKDSILYLYCKTFYKVVGIIENMIIMFITEKF